MIRDSSTSLAPGFRFHPTDEELISYYLRRKVSGKSFRFDPISVIDIYKSEPWDLPCLSKLRSKDLEWYFFSPLDKKYGNGSRTNRATEKGYWKTTGKDRPVKHNSKIVGMKKTLVYHNGRAPRGARSNWVMHEYKLVEDESLLNQGISLDAFVLCRIFQKSGSGPKNGEQYGAPYVEEEWDEDDKEEQLPAGDAVGNEVVALDDSFLETNDLKQNLEICTPSEWGPQPLNFHHGETSNYAEYYQGFNSIDEKPVIGNVEPFESGNNLSQQHEMEAKPLVGNLETSEDRYNLSEDTNLFVAEPAVEARSVAGNIETLDSHNLQSLGMTPPHAMEANPLDDDCVGNASKDGNPLGFSYSLDELNMDAIDDSLAHNFIVDELFLEANDLTNPIDIENAVGADMIDEYLTCLDTDGDITQYINFDAFESSEDYPVESLPGDEQLMHDQTEVLDVARKHDKEAVIDFEGSSTKHIEEEVKFDKGMEYPFLKQASQMLGSIPAPPAFASEFPTKGATLQLHNAAEASSSVHITTGMIRIRNITTEGSGRGLTLGKNGDMDIILSSHLYPSNGTSAAIEISGLLSRKTAFVVSHGWVFLMFFWVLILSVSCKLGSFMYTNK